MIKLLRKQEKCKEKKWREKKKQNKEISYFNLLFADVAFFC